MKRILAILLACAGCADGSDARPYAARIAAAAGLQREDAQAGPFRLLRYARFTPGAPVLRVYIEGDGHAWSAPDRPSADPTPWQPVGLELAAQDPADSVAWVARPCQYIAPGADPACAEPFWTEARYAEPVIASVDAAIGQLLARSGAKSLELVGFSGGGAVAALVAARRKDVASLRTVSADLDTETWTRSMRLTPLRASLNPADETDRLAHLPQLHFWGTADRVVGRSVAEAFRARFSRPGCVSIVSVAGLQHGEGWPAAWRQLLRRPVLCNRDS